jgi:exopolysaccharide production protein ExoZ
MLALSEPRRFEPALLTTIQGARGAAAMAVVLAHAGTILGFPEYLRYIPLHGAFRAGHAGVDFFFVLSGFIIATVHARDIGRSGAIWAYAKKRLLRIYPAYWTALCIGIAIAAFGFSGAVSVGLSNVTDVRLLTSLILCPLHQEPLLGVAWTLEHEMLFYLLFGLLILHRGAGALAMLIWFMWSIAVAIAVPFDNLPWAPVDLLTGFLGSSYHLQFAAGIAAAVLVARGWVPVPRTFAMIGAVGFALTAVAEDTGGIVSLGQPGRLMFGGSAVLIVAGLAAAERQGLARVGRLPVLLGTASYSIYLVHVPAMMLLAGGLAAIGVPGWTAMLLLAFAGMASGLALHVLVERPALRALHRMALSSRAGNSGRLTP